MFINLNILLIKIMVIFMVIIIMIMNTIEIYSYEVRTKLILSIKLIYKISYWFIYEAF